jgi:hypothetical protein
VDHVKIHYKIPCANKKDKTFIIITPVFVSLLLSAGLQQLLRSGRFGKYTPSTNTQQERNGWFFLFILLIVDF